MKTLFQLFFFASLFLSCNKSEKTKGNSVVTNDSTSVSKNESNRLQSRKEIAGQEKMDSLMMTEVLSEALIIASKNSNKTKFKDKFEIQSDNLGIIEVNMDLGNHLDKISPSLIIRRQTSSLVYIDIFSKTGNKFQKLISHELWSLTYVNDTIRDINGDGLKDFVVNWYGSAGCCLKAFSNIYLLRPDNTFSKNFEFINPTFSPKEKVIRGVCYGQPGQTEMYKYKWDGEKVDTLEYVYFEKKGENKTGKVIISNRNPYDANIKIFKKLNEVPAEYKQIEGYDWFMGNTSEK